MFVRVRPESADLINRFPVDCGQLRFVNPPEANGINGEARRFDYYLNAAAILLTLGRDADALELAGFAASTTQENAALHYVKGVAHWRLGDANRAEQELRKAADQNSLDASSALARFYDSRRQYADEVAVLEHAANVSLTPYTFYLKLGYAEIAQGRSDEALAAFDKAEASSPYVGEAYDSYGYGAAFRQQISEGRSLARQNSR